MTIELPVLTPEDGFRRIKIEIAYDGSNFNGWARQKDDPSYISKENPSGSIRTLQEEIEKALSLLAHDPVQTIVAGRTDAGVHAIKQVIHADIPLNSFTDEPWDISNWEYKLNRILTPEIRVKKVEQAPPYFHARFSALSRSYIYKIADNNQFISPLERLDVATWYRGLDVAKMNKLAARFIGEFDFVAFCKYRENSSTIREIQEFTVSRSKNNLVEVRITADAFCYNMVRSLVGALVAVGEGRFEENWALEILENKVRPSDSYVFPAQGLTLTNVNYPPDNELLERAKRTIGRRDLEAESD